MFNSENISFLGSDLDDKSIIPISVNGLATDSSEASDSIRQLKIPLDLNRELIKSPASTFFARLRDGSMENDGDLLIIDKSIEPYSGCLVVVFIDNEFILKRIKIEKDTISLISESNNSKPIIVTLDNSYTIWGVVKYLIKKM